MPTAFSDSVPVRPRSWPARLPFYYGWVCVGLAALGGAFPIQRLQLGGQNAAVLYRRLLSDGVRVVMLRARCSASPEIASVPCSAGTVGPASAQPAHPRSVGRESPPQEPDVRNPSSPCWSRASDAARAASGPGRQPGQ